MVEVDIDRLARLGGLFLSQEAKEKIFPSLSKIIEYFRMIKGLSKNLPPRQLEFTCPRRKEEEKVHKEIRLEKEFLATLPNYKDGYFQVPRIWE